MDPLLPANTVSDARRHPLTAVRRRVARVRRALLRRRRLLAFLAASAATWATLQQLSPPVPPSTPVVVAASALSPGEPLTPSDLMTIHVSPGDAPDGAVTDPGEVAGQGLTMALARGEPVTAPRLRRAGLLAAYPDLVALPIRFPDASMVALLRVGDLIDVVGTDPHRARAQTLARGVRVLNIPDATTGGASTPAGGGSSGRVVVIGVTPEVVETLAGHAVSDYLIFTFSD